MNGHIIALELFLENASPKTLKQALTQVDCSFWTPLHYLAALDDKGKLYRAYKMKAGIPKKYHEGFYCNSASFLRKLMKPSVKYLSGGHGKEQTKMFYQDPHTGEETLLNWEQFHSTFAKVGSIAPSHFKLIPQYHSNLTLAMQLERVSYLAHDYKRYFDEQMANQPYLANIDFHLNSLLLSGYESHLAFTPTLKNDLGENLEVNLGLGW